MWQSSNAPNKTHHLKMLFPLWYHLDDARPIAITNEAINFQKCSGRILKKCDNLKIEKFGVE
jgi:hypothetical protein